ncbi:MAG TPA: hypothetical protein VIA61_00735 [Methylomirabilota bacterium]|jgi:hypothetical protein
MAERTRVRVLFFVLTWLTGLVLAASFASAAYGFGRMAEPERTDLISLAMFGVIGLLSQAGLLLAPWAITRGPTPRTIAALLMGPSGAFLSIFAYEGFTRYGAGAPIWVVAWAAYVCGVFVYAVAYVALARGRLERRPGE